VCVLAGCLVSVVFVFAWLVVLCTVSPPPQDDSVEYKHTYAATQCIEDIEYGTRLRA
jgi:hypothetical protein